MISWTVNPRMDVTVSRNWTKDDYIDSQYGLQNADNVLVFVDGTIHASKTLDLTGGWGFGQMKSKMASNEVSASARYDTLYTLDWSMDEGPEHVRVRERRVAGEAEARREGRLHVQPLDELLRLQLKRVAPKVAPVVTPAAPAARWTPNTFYRTHDVTLELRWKWTASMDLAVRGQYVQFDVADFAVENMPLLGGSLSGSTFTPNAIYLGDSYRDYGSPCGGACDSPVLVSAARFTKRRGLHDHAASLARREGRVPRAVRGRRVTNIARRACSITSRVRPDAGGLHDSPASRVLARSPVLESKRGRRAPEGTRRLVVPRRTV